MADQELYEIVIKARITPIFRDRVYDNMRREGIKETSQAIRQALVEWCDSREERRTQSALERGRGVTQ